MSFIGDNSASDEPNKEEGIWENVSASTRCPKAGKEGKYTRFKLKLTLLSMIVLLELKWTF